MNANYEHLDAEAAQVAQGLDALAQAERATAGAGFEGRIAGATHPHLIAAKAKAVGLSLAGTAREPAAERRATQGTRRVMPAMRIAAGLGVAAVVTFVIMGRGTHTPTTLSDTPVAFTDAEWSMVFADSGASDLFTDAERIETGLRNWTIDEDSTSEGAM